MSLPKFLNPRDGSPIRGFLVGQQGKKVPPLRACSSVRVWSERPKELLEEFV